MLCQKWQLWVYIGIGWYEKNSKVFEQKGDLLNFKANIDPRAVLSRVKPGWAESSSVELSQAK